MWQWILLYSFIFVVAAFIVSETEDFRIASEASDSSRFDVAAFLNSLAYAVCGAAMCAASLVVVFAYGKNGGTGAQWLSSAPQQQQQQQQQHAIRVTPAGSHSKGTIGVADTILGLLTGAASGIDMEQLLSLALQAGTN